MNTLENTYNYNDLASLNLITKKGRENESEALREVSRQYESMFVRMMLKSMRDANAVFEEGNPLSSNESKFYRDMFDDQLALSLSKGRGMGLADSIYRQLSEQLKLDENVSGKEEELKNSGVSNVNDSQDAIDNPFSSLKPSLDFPKGVDTGGTLFEANDPLNYLLPPKAKDSVIESKKEMQKLSIHYSIENTKKSSQDASNEVQAVDKKTAFNSPEEFIEKLWPVAKGLADEKGINPQAVIAQAALETGWGKHVIQQANGNSSHNLFGIKADSRWKGEVAKVNTLEYRNGIAQKERAPFRVYDSFEESIKDYLYFVNDNSRYEHAVKNGQSLKNYSEGLQDAGYATDPKYAQKIQRIANGDLLKNAINRVNRG